MRARFWPGATALLLIAAGCSNPPRTEGEGGSVASQAPTTAAPAALPASANVEVAEESPADPAPQPALPRKIIYTGELTLATDNLDRAGAQLEAKVKEVGGYIGNATRSGTRGVAREATWTVRVPATRFEGFLAGLPGLGELETSSRKAEDVSEEFYDVQARLKNKRVEEARLIQLLQHATGRLTEVLSVEKEISRVREEVERIEGRLRFLSNQTDLSTVTITLREVKNYVPEGPPTVGTRLSRALSGSLETMQEVGVGALVALVALLPWLIPLGIVALVVVKLARPRKS